MMPASHRKGPLPLRWAHMPSNVRVVLVSATDTKPLLAEARAPTIRLRPWVLTLLEALTFAAGVAVGWWLR